MSIRLQLNLLISAILASFMIAIGAYLMILAPSERIQSDQKVLEGVSDSLNRLRLDLALSSSLPLRAQMDAIKTSRDSVERHFESVQNLRYLKNADKTIQVSLVSVQSQQLMISMNLDEFDMRINGLLDRVSPLFPDADSVRSRDIYDLLLDSEMPEAESLAYDLGIFFDEIGGLDQKMGGIAQVLDRQFEAIGEQVRKIESRSESVSIALMTAIVAAGAILGLAISGRIHASFKGVENHIRVLERGELGSDFASGGKSEIGQLSARLNMFLSNLRSVVVQIKAVLRKNEEIKLSLVDMSGRSSASLEEMRASISAVESRINLLDDRIAESSTSSARIASRVGDLDSLLADLGTMVEETSASIVQMIASIGSVARIAVDRRNSANELVAIAVDGGEKLATMADNIHAVDSNLDDVNEIVQVIMNISTQTNLLAMNAAIEAAHAGEAGKGFSVVAEEIRGLAEAVNEQSKNIKDDIEKIVGMIKAASGESEATLKAFKSINEGVVALDRSFSEISDTMTEINSGGIQVDEAVTRLREISVNAKDASREIADSSKATSEASKAVTEISAFVRSSMSDISCSSESISEAAEKTAGYSLEMSRISEEMNKRIAFFRTDGESA